MTLGHSVYTYIDICIYIVVPSVYRLEQSGDGGGTGVRNKRTAGLVWSLSGTSGHSVLARMMPLAMVVRCLDASHTNPSVKRPFRIVTLQR